MEHLIKANSTFPGVGVSTLRKRGTVCDIPKTLQKQRIMDKAACDVFKRS